MEYEVSPDIREKEKVVGGIFTLTQTIFLGLGLLIGGGTAIMVFTSTGNMILTILDFFILGGIFFPFAFIKIPSMGDMELFRYLMIRLKFVKQQKIYVNFNENNKKYLTEK